MSQAIADLWPDFNVEVLSPVSILRHQAGQLREHTKGLLEADVRTSISETQDLIFHEFRIIAPGLDRYTYVLFSAIHGKMLVYPTSIRFSPWIKTAQDDWWEMRRLKDNLPSSRSLIISADEAAEIPDGYHKASTQAELYSELRGLIGSDYTRGVIDSLLARLNDARAKQDLTATIQADPAAKSAPS